MEEQNLGLIDSTTENLSDESVGLEKSTDSIIETEDSLMEPSTDSEKIFSIIEDSFPKNQKIRKYSLPQAAQWLGTRFFAVWVWPIVGINKLRIFIKNIDIVQPVNEQSQEKYEVKDTETIYTMTKDSFSGKGGMKFFGIRFMSIWVFPIAITGAVMEFLFVGPLKGTNPFG